MQPITAVLCVAASLVLADALTCESYRDAINYNATTRQLTAPGYVVPLTTTTSIPQRLAALAYGENATASVQVNPEDTERTLNFGETVETLRQKVDGMEILKDNPIFGSWDEKTDEWLGSYCNYNAVTDYLRGGGAGLRIRRKNLSTLTVFNVHDPLTEYTAEPAPNDDDIVIVFTDPAIVEISLEQANIIKINLPADGGFLPIRNQDDQYVPNICVATKRGERALMSDTDGWWDWQVSRELTNSYGTSMCSGVSVEYIPSTWSPTPSPTASGAALHAPNLSAIMLGFFFVMSFALF